MKRTPDAGREGRRLPNQIPAPFGPLQYMLLPPLGGKAMWRLRVGAKCTRLPLSKTRKVTEAGGEKRSHELKLAGRPEQSNLQVGSLALCVSVCVSRLQ